jgi:hypothetical protein
LAIATSTGDDRHQTKDSIANCTVGDPQSALLAIPNWPVGKLQPALLGDANKAMRTALTAFNGSSTGTKYTPTESSPASLMVSVSAAFIVRRNVLHLLIYTASPIVGYCRRYDPENTSASCNTIDYSARH